MRNFPLMIILALPLVACTGSDDTRGDSEPSEDELIDGLGDLGKADATRSDVSVGHSSVSLRGSVARVLYNAMTDAGSPAVTGNGRRLVRGSRTACITNGEATFCQVFGLSTELAGGATEARFRGSAARFVGSLVIGTWFDCRDGSGNNAFCEVERSEVVSLEFDGLEDLGDTFVYEGWAITANFGALTTDRFGNPGGEINQRIPLSVAAEDITYVLTIEPRRGDASGPSATHVIAGALTQGSDSVLDSTHPAALGTDFADAIGAYILATPTTTDESDNPQGIWFVDPAAGEPSLSLPTLPDGWAYEGWVVGADGPISTGRFTDVSGADSDGAGPAAGTEGFPPFPGQDFIHPAMDLRGTTIVISVEPEPDNSAAPFALKPLIDMTVDDVAPPATQSLELTDLGIVAATASFAVH